MSTPTPEPAPVPGLFGLLAQRQLVQHASPASGSFRPWLPYAFDGPPSVSELDSPPAPLPSDAAGVAPQSPTPRHQESDDVELASVQPPVPAASTPEFDKSSESALRRRVDHGVTTAPIEMTPSRPIVPAHTVKEVSRSSRAGHVSDVVASPARGWAPTRNEDTESGASARERASTVEPAAQAVRRLSPPLESSTPPPRVVDADAGARPRSSVRGRDIISAKRLMPRVPLPSVPFRLQRESAAEPTIEIHIGRIEVRAHSAPATQAVSEATTVPDQRLAAYLRRRGTGARS